jgi:hypothetical protein
LAADPNQRDAGELIIYGAFVEGKPDAPKTLLSDVPRNVLWAGASGILGQNDMELVERLYQRL